MGIQLICVVYSVLRRLASGFLKYILTPCRFHVKQLFVVVSTPIFCRNLPLPPSVIDSACLLVCDCLPLVLPSACSVNVFFSQYRTLDARGYGIFARQRDRKPGSYSFSQDSFSPTSPYQYPYTQKHVQQLYVLHCNVFTALTDSEHDKLGVFMVTVIQRRLLFWR